MDAGLIVTSPVEMQQADATRTLNGRRTTETVAAEASKAGCRGSSAENGCMPAYSPRAPGQEGSQDKELGMGKRILNRVDEKMAQP